MIVVVIMVFIHNEKVMDNAKYALWMSGMQGVDERKSPVYCDMASDKQSEKYIAFSCSDKKVIEFRKDEEDGARWVMQAYTAEQ
ncbi:hypothetical protein RX799_24835 [Klebsiella oxytoca]|uniref:hypothetical protein n=1 Tax=Klebsiella oxytoca TaxID=571 RepID=UPI0038516111